MAQGSSRRGRSHAGVCISSDGLEPLLDVLTFLSVQHMHASFYKHALQDTSARSIVLSTHGKQRTVLQLVSNRSGTPLCIRCNAPTPCRTKPQAYRDFFCSSKCYTSTTAKVGDCMHELSAVVIMSVYGAYRKVTDANFKDTS